MNPKALLVVSFGTSFEETRRKTIDAIEADLAAAFPDRRLYRAWTSKMIIKKLKKRDGVAIDTVPEALARMAKDGVRDVLVQPTHVLDGLENQWMRNDLQAAAGDFDIIAVGAPLLVSTDDLKAVAAATVASLPPLEAGEALVLMGHGSSHSANMTYPALAYVFRDLGYRNVFIGTVEGYPTLDNVLRDLAMVTPKVKKVVLAPFMVVAGDHARNDMAGEDGDSWKNRFQADGYATDCVLRGLGEFSPIRDLFVAHAKDAGKSF